MITKHVTVDHDNVRVRMDRGANVSTLEIDVEIPNAANLDQGRVVGEMAHRAPADLANLEPRLARACRRR